MRSSRVVSIGVCCLALAGIAWAQSAISAKAGMVNYTEGKVLLDGAAVKVKFDNFPQIRMGSELRTGDGRAEVLLGPGVFMRLGENSAVRMISDDLMSTHLEFLAGSVFVEGADLAKDEAVTFSYQGSSIDLLKKGLYRFDGEPAKVSVYDGEARVIVDGQAQVVRRAHLLRLDGVGVAEKFDATAGDDLFRWARRRAEYLAVANVSAAKEAEQYGFWGSNNWIWNPSFGTYTYLPMNGFYDSPWGYRFWSPASIYMLYVPPQSSSYAVVSKPSQSGVTAVSTAVSSSGARSVSAARSSVSGGAPGHAASSVALVGRGGAHR